VHVRHRGVLSACVKTRRDPLPELSTDLNPPGERLDLRASNYFPMSLGDRWTYEKWIDGRRSWRADRASTS